MSYSSQAHLAHQFDDLSQQHRATTLGMWVFLVTEIMTFGGLFAVYAVYRVNQPAAFRAGSTGLSVPLGTVNTLVLLVSSYTVALAIHAARTGRQRAMMGLLAATMLLGLAFLGVKGYEYQHEFHQHHVPGPEFEWPTAEADGVKPGHVEMFFGLYFAMTGLHAAHMVVGEGIFLVLLVMACKRRFSEAHHQPLELAGLYWHFVDIVWVFLFPLLYLVA